MVVEHPDSMQAIELRLVLLLPCQADDGVTLWQPLAGIARIVASASARAHPPAAGGGPSCTCHWELWSCRVEPGSAGTK